MGSLAEERVTDQRALYFSISSDLLPTNLSSLTVVAANIIIFELLVILTGRLKLFTKAHQVLCSYRGDIYMGLIISNMIPVSLPWKSSGSGGFVSFPAKATLAAHFLILNATAFVILAWLLGEIQRCKREKYPNRFRVALFNWWPIFQALSFPFLVVLENPLPFMVFSSCSHILYLYLSFSSPEWRLSAVVKSIYPILFHSCFVVFMVT